VAEAIKWLTSSASSGNSLSHYELGTGNSTIFIFYLFLFYLFVLMR
jgi:hypothetical protein